MPDRMPKNISNRMLKDILNKILENISNKMSEIWSNGIIIKTKTRQHWKINKESGSC